MSQTNNSKPATRSDVTRSFNQAESATALFARVIEQGNGDWIAEEATARRAQNPDFRPAVQIMQLRRMPRAEGAPIITLSWDKEAKAYRLAEAAPRAPRAEKDLAAELRRLVDAYGFKSVTDTLAALASEYAGK